MLLSLLALMLVASGDSVSAKIDITAVTQSSPPVEWLLLDSANALIDHGRTPSELDRTISSAAQTICAKEIDQQIAVTLSVPSMNISFEGTARCFLIRRTNGKIQFEGMPAPTGSGGL